MSNRKPPNDHCTRRWCGAALVERFVPEATVRYQYICEPCERNAAGICRDCDQPIAKPRAFRCVAHALEREQACANAGQRRRYRENDEYRHRQVESQRERRKRPEVKAAIREWNAKQPRKPREEGDRLYWRAYREAHPLTPEQKARRKELQRARREQQANDPTQRAKRRAAYLRRRANPAQRALENAKSCLRNQAKRKPYKNRRPIDLAAILAARCEARRAP